MNFFIWEDGDYILRKITLFLIVFSMLFINVGCNSTKRDSDKKVLIVGVEGTYAPFNWMQTHEEKDTWKIRDGLYVAGYDIVIANILAEKLDVEIKVKIIDWEGLLPALMAGEIDAIMSGISPLEERKNSIEFTNNYYQSDLVVVVMKDSTYINSTSIHDFVGAKITAQINTFPYTVIEQMDGVKKMNAYEDFPTMIAGLTSGKIDAYVCERTPAMAAAANNANITYLRLDETFKYDLVQASSSIGMRIGDERVGTINDVLSSITIEERERYMMDCIEKSYAFIE